MVLLRGDKGAGPYSRFVDIFLCHMTGNSGQRFPSRKASSAQNEATAIASEVGKEELADTVWNIPALTSFSPSSVRQPQQHLLKQSVTATTLSLLHS